MRRAVRAVFQDPEDLRAEDVAKSEVLRNLLKIHVPKAIEEAIVKKKIYAPLFEINETGHYVEIHKNHWVGALETCLVWYVDEEDYEMCNHIKNLIKSIQSKPTKKISINKTDGEGLQADSVRG